MNEGDRRHVLINTMKLNYTQEQWDELWARVEDGNTSILYSSEHMT